MASVGLASYMTVVVALASYMSVVVALAACERADLGATKSVRIPAGQFETTLREAGAEPRIPLRYQENLERIQFERVVDIVDVTGTSSISQPLTRETFESWVVDTDREGVAHVRTKVLDIVVEARSPEAPIAAVTARHVKTFRGTTADAWVDTRGRHARDGVMVVAADAEVDRATLDDLSGEEMVVFPEEPVGIGARWQFTARTASTSVSSEAELVGIEGDVVDLRVTSEVQRRYDGLSEVSRGTTFFKIALRTARTTANGTSHIVFDGLEGVRNVTFSVRPLPR